MESNGDEYDRLSFARRNGVFGRLKYADEKSLKGKDICNKLARQDPFTGIVPPTMTDPDLRNTYSIIGICGISRKLMSR